MKNKLPLTCLRKRRGSYKKKVLMHEDRDMLVGAGRSLC